MHKLAAIFLIILALPLLVPVVLLSGVLGGLTLLVFAAMGHDIPWRSLSNREPPTDAN